MKANTPVDLVAMSVKLDECHKAMKAMHGPAFEGHVKAMAPYLRTIATAKNDNMIAGALEAVKDCAEPQTVALILAVAVELAQRDNAAQMGNS